MPLFITLAEAFTLYDIPDKYRKTHQRKIPFTGGFSIIASCLLAIVALFIFSDETFRSYQIKPDFSLYLYFAEATFVVVILGVIDDMRDLAYTTKFLYQFIAAFLVILGAINSSLLPLPSDAGGTSVLTSSATVIISILWFVGMTNAVNMIDGMDGLAGGTTLLSAISLGVLALMWGNPTLPTILFIIAGALLGFLLFNFHPARVFMGNTGSMVIGFAISVCSWVLLDSGPDKSTTMFVPLVILGLPLTDTLLAFFRRLIKGKNPFSADMFHIHHMLKFRFNLSHRATVLVLYAISAILGGAGILIASIPAGPGWAVIIALLGGMGLFLHKLGYTNLLASDKQEMPAADAVPPGRNGKGHHLPHISPNGNGVKKRQHAGRA